MKLYLITLLFALATFAYAAFSTIAKRPAHRPLPQQIRRHGKRASSGTAAGIGTILAFELIGHFSDTRQATATDTFDPIVIVAEPLIPFVGMILVLLLVRNNSATDEGLVKRI